MDDVQESPWRRGLRRLLPVVVAVGVALTAPAIASADQTPPPGDGQSSGHRREGSYEGQHRDPDSRRLWPFGSAGKHRDAGIFKEPYRGKHVKRGVVVKFRDKATGEVLKRWVPFDSSMSDKEINQVIRCMVKCLGKKLLDSKTLDPAQGVKASTIAQWLYECGLSCYEEHRQRKAKGDGDDDGDTGGTPAKSGPKGPKSPSTGTAVTPKHAKPSKGAKTKNVVPGVKTVPPGTKAVKPETGAKAVVPKTGTTAVVPKTGAKTGTTAVAPKVGRVAPFVGPKSPVPLGVRGGRSGLTSAVVGENSSLLVRGYLDAKHQEWYRKALQDEKLRKRIIADYQDLKDNNHFEDWKRAFDGSKEFASGTTRAIAPDLIKYQKSLDEARKVAKKSNADPLYQQARRECGGYDTCVQDRVKKLRDKSAKGVAKAERNAKKSNADPLYQQARRECGGYDTCVQDRVKKLRDKSAKGVAKAERNAKKSNADPLYQQARRECGGYDTCVQDRVKKLRQQAAAPKKTTTGAKNATPKKTTPKKTTTKPKQTTAKVDPAVAKKQYEEANRVCGGYDTCVKDRLAKVRGTGAKATTPAKKTETKKTGKTKTKTTKTKK
ncbi:hypothetical protein [Saccharothrix obliqua]|uniref:hypothetical protein n=1 Tax=Saccharothrix obliqua TaxID=2861747 RepID=UPI001C5D3CB6|nr:hypothetical protein [Saccharothrix obliqua]MBW4716437.1 hypothetical protein [Saccharothrix obliqua]